jgi:hypothetical protein
MIASSGGVALFGAIDDLTDDERQCLKPCTDEIQQALSKEQGPSEL